MLFDEKVNIIHSCHPKNQASNRSRYTYVKDYVLNHKPLQQRICLWHNNYNAHHYQYSYLKKYRID